MNQRKSESGSTHDLVPYDPARMVKAEPVYGDYYYGYAQSKSAMAKSYLQIFYRQRMLMIAIFAGLMILGLGWLFTRKPLYRATAEVLVMPTDRGNSTTDIKADSIDVMTRVRSVSTQMKLMQSPDLLDRAFTQLPEDLRLSGFGSTDPKEVNYRVSITNPKDTEIIGIEVLARRPTAAKEFANQIVMASGSSRSDNVKAMTIMATQQVNDELNSTQAELDQARSELATLKKQHSIEDLPVETATTAQSLANLQAQVAQAQSDLNSSMHRRDTLATELRRTPASRVTDVIHAQNPMINTLNDNIEKLEGDRAQLLQEYRPTAPEVRSVDREIADAQARKARLMNEIISSSNQVANPVYDTLQQDYINALVSIHEAQSRLGTMSAHAAAMRNKMNMLPEFEKQLAGLLSKINELETSHTFLATQKQHLDYNSKTVLPNVLPITRAQANPFPVSPNIPTSLLMMLIFSALISVSVALLRDQLDDRIHTSDKVESSYGYRVLASIPMVQNGFRGLVTDESCPASLLESFRILRNNVFLTGPDAGRKVIVVTSPRAGEGKSTTVANLAITTAISHKHVLLIDGDLRHPSVHDAFGLSNDVGLSSVLQGEALLEQCIQDTTHPNLRVLPAGPIPAFPPELLASPAMKQMLATLREEYDTILLDCTPLLHLSDGAQLASLADGAILVISSSKTEQGNLLEAIRTLEQLEVPVLGIVYNRAGDTGPLEWVEVPEKAIEYHHAA